MSDELDAQVDFLLEIDKLKGVSRRSLLIDGSRFENSAEHSWHVAVSASLLARYASPEVDVSHVMTMLLIHDIVEIDAGDTFAYDAEGRADQHEREAVAGRRIFGLLPSRQAEELIACWEEFDAAQTKDAVFANAVDRLLPVLHNYFNEGHTWKKNGVKRSQVMVRVAPIEVGLPALWPYVTSLLDDAVSKGYLAP